MGLKVLRLQVSLHSAQWHILEWSSDIDSGLEVATPNSIAAFKRKGCKAYP